ncbi:uncharacterized protein HRG_11726 [Hirsutella rhossiliensis]|uniref:Uncharacterized protein n=1 Tax=Hirsutella rhossiliensis TaxID=111463 RepID=A0A9P8MQ51_9HYPO|nr:uncharacterized protein HRG_11726 [Hirsutella rhossiliensis]KAH0957177.1 hypothetical protein HRG_11726 [Hirsutella rhossiliensis]
MGTSGLRETHSKSGHVEAVIVRCEAEKRKFPFGLIEVPLVLDRTGTQSVNEADLDNQIATYLNIDANSGFAPPDWQSQVGTVVVARKDRKPFYPQHLEGVWMFCDHILDLFGKETGRRGGFTAARRSTNGG